MASLAQWVDERTGFSAIQRVLFFRKIPQGASWFYTLGFATLFVFILQVLTGTALALFYSPSPDHAYESITYIQTVLPWGSALRGLHHWGASAMVVLVGLHLVAVFAMGGYKKPREITWSFGVVLLLIVMGLGFTGYLLPWDEKAYWATNVGTNMAGTVPLIGDWLLQVIRGGASVGAVTLTRFYGMHVLLLPGLLILAVAAHLYLVVYLGVSVPPHLWERKGVEQEMHETARYEAFKARGRAFWPEVLIEDAVIAVVVLLVLAGLTVFAGVPLEARADPTTTTYIPRPDWYFLFLFQLLKYFPGRFEWVGVVALPLLVVLGLFFLPFYDRRPARRLLRRPVAAAFGTAGILSVGVLTAVAVATTPPTSATERGVQLNSTQIVGRSLFQGNCSGCHGVNLQGVDGPPLTRVGTLRDASYVHLYIEDPKELNPAAKMPAFIPPPGIPPRLTHDQVEAITEYLMTFH